MSRIGWITQKIKQYRLVFILWVFSCELASIRLNLLGSLCCLLLYQGLRGTEDRGLNWQEGADEKKLSRVSHSRPVSTASSFHWTKPQDQGLVSGWSHPQGGGGCPWNFTSKLIIWIITEENKVLKCVFQSNAESREELHPQRLEIEG